jgi:hypothetical protein
MSINPHTLEQFELDLETARGQVSTGYLDPAASPDTKLLAAAIVQAGTEIALAISRDSSRES